MSKLTEEEARQIKYNDFKDLNNDEIGEIFNIKGEQVRRIRKGDRWKHI